MFIAPMIVALLFVAFSNQQICYESCHYNRPSLRLSIPGGTDDCVQIGGGARSTARGDGKGLFSTLSLKTDINSCGKTRNVVIPLAFLQ